MCDEQPSRRSDAVLDDDLRRFDWTNREHVWALGCLKSDFGAFRREEILMGQCPEETAARSRADAGRPMLSSDRVVKREHRHTISVFERFEITLSSNLPLPAFSGAASRPGGSPVSRGACR